MKSTLLLLLVLALIVSLSLPPARPAQAAVTGAVKMKANAAISGVVTLSDQSFTQVAGTTQAKSFFSLTAPHNFVGLEVKDADLNIHSLLPGSGAVPGAGIVPFEIVGVGGATTYQLNQPTAGPPAKAVADVNGTVIVTDDILVRTLQDGTAFSVGAVNANTGAVTLTASPPTFSPVNPTKVNNLAVAADLTPQALTNAMTSVAKLRVTVTLGGGASLGSNGVQITGTTVNPITLAETAGVTETLLANANTAGANVATTAAFFKPGVTFAVDFGAAPATVTIEELATVIAIYQTDVVERLPGVGITSSTSTALGFTRTITLTETSASSGIFRATMKLVRDTTDPCFPPVPTADVAGCETALTLGDNKYFGALVVQAQDTIIVTYNDVSNGSGVAVVATATATVDLTPPTLTIRSPTDRSSTNIGTIAFFVDVTDAAAGVDNTAIFSGATPASAVFAGIPSVAAGTATAVSAIGQSPIANGFNLAFFATGITDRRYDWFINVTDMVGNAPKIINNVDPATDFCGNNATRGSRGNPYQVTVGTTKPTMNSAKTGVAGVPDTRVQEAGITTYPDTIVTTPVISAVRQPPAGAPWFADAPYSGQPVNCATFGKLTDDVNINIIKDALDATRYIPDPSKKGTAKTAIKVIVNTSASGKVSLDKNTIAPADFTVAGVAPTKVDVGPSVSGVGQALYLTTSVPLATDATPSVEVVGAIADTAGNELFPANLTQAEIQASVHRVPAATDGLVHVLTLGMTITGNQATITVTSSEALPGLSVSVCVDANSNNVCDTAENPVTLTMAVVSPKQYQGSYVLQPGDLAVKKVVATGWDAAGNVGRTAQVLGTGPTRISFQAPAVVRPGEQFTTSAQVLIMPSLNVAATAGMPVTFNYVLYKLQSGGAQTGSATVNTNAQGEATLVFTAPMETSVILFDAVFLDWGGLRASSNMWMVSVLPIVNARLTATSSGGNVVFTLQDIYGNAMPSKTLTLTTTSGNLSAASGVTNASGQVSLTLSGTTEAVVSASFGGWISPQGWAYQPTMVRITVSPG